MRKPKLRMRPYRAGDEAAFTPAPDFARAIVANGYDWDQGPPGPTWSICRWSGEVVGLGGAIEHPVEPGQFHAWAQLAEVARRDWPQLLWLAERVLMRLILQRGARRITAHALDQAAMRCLMRLRFASAGPVAIPAFDEVYLFQRTA